MAGTWLTTALKRIRELAKRRRVSFTLKALRELTELGFDQDDACDVLAGLICADCEGRHRSIVTGEWLYVFKPEVSGSVLYVKVVLRANCVLISFHEDEEGSDDQTA
jgi:hypothetical protein